MKTACIYALCEPNTRTVRYIGKTVDLTGRFKSHLRDSPKKKSYLGNWLRGIVARQEKPNLVVLCEVPVEDGFSEERRYIRIARDVLGMRLVNATDGGEGVTMTPETRGKISAALTGRIFSEEHRASISATHLPMDGKNNPFYGQRHSSRTKELISQKNSGRIRSEECRLAASRQWRGVPKSAEHRAKIGAANRNRVVTPETRAKLSKWASSRLGSRNSFFGKKHTREARAKIGAANRKA